MKNLVLTFIVAFALFSFKNFKANISLSGEWKLNEAKSELGDFGKRFAVKVIKIEQQDDAIIITKTANNFQGESVTNTETLKFDGTDSETTVFGNSKKHSTAKWSDDGQTLTISTSTKFERNGQTSEMKSSESWSIKDGMLSLIIVSSSPRGENTTNALYDK